MRALTYSLSEALASLRRGRRSALLSILTIASTLLVLGTFLLFVRNARTVLEGWTAAAEVSVYLRDDVTEEQRGAVEQTLRGSGVAADVAYVSKDAALARFKQDFPDLAAVADSERNPLPASFEIRIRPGRLPDEVERVAQSVAAQAGVADVRYDRRWLERLLTLLEMVQWVGGGLALLLVGGTALTVANVVRLACYARRDEIAIMELVGAPGVFVRGPFVVEGILQGAAGALLALGLLWIGAWWLSDQLQSSPPLASLGRIDFLSPLASIGLLFGGMLVGCLGGLAGASTAARLATISASQSTVPAAVSR